MPDPRVVESTNIAKRVILARLVAHDGLYFDGNRWVGGVTLAQTVAEQIVRDLGLDTVDVQSQTRDDCTNPEPMDGVHYGYCRNCGGMLVANQAEETDDADSLLVMVHPPKGRKP